MGLNFKFVISLSFLIVLSRLCVLQTVKSQTAGSPGDKGYSISFIIKYYNTVILKKRSEKKGVYLKIVIRMQ